jgi:transposase
MRDWQKLNQKQKKALIRRVQAEDAGLDVVHPNAAGIDVGNNSHYVAISPKRDPEPVREFHCFTEDLKRLAEWLASRGIQTVAMQSTGVYWIPLYDILEEHGIEVFLVNARYTRNLPGRKTDVQESQWLLKLHTYGLLNNSFRPSSEIRTMRTYWRLRAEHVREASIAIQRMQKALTQMNIQLANVISDISGVSGMAIIRAIVAGERDPQHLAALCDRRIRATPKQVIDSLKGNWRVDLLFALSQQLRSYDHYQQQIALCDQQLQSHIQALPTRATPASETAAQPSAAKQRNKKRNKPQRNAPQFDLAAELKRIAGVDLTLIDGIDVMTAQTIASETGFDMSPWRTEAHFASWLGLCPDNRISGGTVLSRATRHVVNPLATSLRMAASTLIRSQSYLGAQYRRLRTRLGAPKAITAMAHRLSRSIYRMLKYGLHYIDKGADFYEKKYAELQIINLKKKAAKFGLQLVQTT